MSSIRPTHYTGHLRENLRKKWWCNRTVEQYLVCMGNGTWCVQGLRFHSLAWLWEGGKEGEKRGEPYLGKKWYDCLPQCHRPLHSFSPTREMTKVHLMSLGIGQLGNQSLICSSSWVQWPGACDITQCPPFPPIGKREDGAGMFYSQHQSPDCPPQGRCILAFLTDVSRK